MEPYGPRSLTTLGTGVSHSSTATRKGAMVKTVKTAEFQLEVFFRFGKGAAGFLGIDVVMPGVSDFADM